MVSVFVPSPHSSSQEPRLGPQGCMNRAFAPGSVLHIHRLVNPEPWLFDCLSWSSAPNETTFDLFFFLHHLSTPRCSCPPSQSGQTDGTMVTWDLLTCGWEKTHSLYHNRANGLFPRKLWFSGVCVRTCSLPCGQCVWQWKHAVPMFLCFLGSSWLVLVADCFLSGCWTTVQCLALYVHIHVMWLLCWRTGSAQDSLKFMMKFQFQLCFLYKLLCMCVWCFLMAVCKGPGLFARLSGRLSTFREPDVTWVSVCATEQPLFKELSHPVSSCA